MYMALVAAIVIAGYDIKTALSTDVSDQVHAFGGVDKGDVVLYVLSATTNVWTTVMVGVKAWYVSIVTWFHVLVCLGDDGGPYVSVRRSRLLLGFIARTVGVCWIKRVKQVKQGN